ncbi:MAG: ABC transporter permease [Acidobacteria bacterium]|nr:ABC transporter permease [Acidobacteriota bacterium]
MGHTFQDLKYAIRGLLKTPSFTFVAIITLALGIGANTAIFSVVNTFILRPLPVRNPERLTVVAIEHEGNQRPHQVSYLDFQDYRAQNDVFEDMAAFSFGFVGLSEQGRADRLTVSFVTGNFFPMFGLQPALGRLIRADEGQKLGADPVIVLGNAFWKRRFGGDPSVVNRSVNINGKPFTIIGVLPPEFHGAYAVADMDGYVPMGMIGLESSSTDSLTKRDEHSMNVRAYLKPGVSLKQAQSSLTVIASRLQKQYPETNKTTTVRVLPENLARPEPSGADQMPLVSALFLGLVGLVLLVACVNVANILLVRATIRQKELSIRAALGAGRGRLIAQLLTESIALSLAGGVGGVVIGLWVNSWLSAIRLPGDLPFRFEIAFDWRVFFYVAGVALLTGIVVGIVPALRASRTNINQALRDGGRSMSGGAEKHRARNILVIAQVAVSLVLLVSAGLFLRSLQHVQTMELGFRSDHLLNLTMDPGQLGYSEARGKTFYKELENRIAALPGVEAASLASSVPLGYNNMGDWIRSEGQVIEPGKRGPSAGYNVVSQNYFNTMKVVLQRGRTFTTEDAAETRLVAVINQHMAERLWPGQDALGRRFELNSEPGKWREVIGVTANGKYQFILEDPADFFYLSQEQKYQSLRTLQVRTSVSPESIGPTVQREIRALETELPVYDVITMEQSLNGGNGFFLMRMGAGFAGALGALGLILAVVGVYGVVSYSASQRTHEIGIRMALGAAKRDVLSLVIGGGLKLVSIGVVVGVLLAAVLGQAMKSLLVGISSIDPVTFGSVSLLLGLVALLACWIPARRATKVDPMVALRYE